jgi:lipoic acid synthetase/lipoate-protein ligase A
VGTVRNDILIGDRKVCGTASYHLPGRSIVHSTLLYDTDMEHMLHAITPGYEKLQAKGIQSVRQRITLLKDYVSLTLEEVKTLIRQTLCDDTLLLSADEVTAIEELEAAYLREEFIHLL